MEPIPAFTSSHLELRRVVGFMIAPVVAAVLAGVLNLASARAGWPVVDAPETVAFSIGLGISSMFVGAPLTVFGAIPLFVWMASRGPLSFLRTLLAGAALGVVWYLLVIAATPLVSLWYGTLAADMRRMAAAFEGRRFFGFLAYLAAVGVGTAATFWCIAIRGTDLDARMMSNTRLSILGSRR